MTKRSPWKGKHRPKRHEKVCKWCGKHFRSHRPDAQYHTSQCRSLAAWDRLKARSTRVYVGIDRR